MKVELVTSLKRKATDIIGELSEEKEPVLITQHGRPAAYLLDVSTYEQMESRISLLEGIARGEKAIEEGRVSSHEQAKEKMSRWLS